MKIVELNQEEMMKIDGGARKRNDIFSVFRRAVRTGISILRRIDKSRNKLKYRDHIRA